MIRVHRPRDSLRIDDPSLGGWSLRTVSARGIVVTRGCRARDWPAPPASPERPGSRQRPAGEIGPGEQDVRGGEALRDRLGHGATWGDRPKSGELISRSRVGYDKWTSRHRLAKWLAGYFGRSDRSAQAGPESGQAVPPSQGECCRKSFIMILGRVAPGGQNWPYSSLTGEGDEVASRPAGLAIAAREDGGPAPWSCEVMTSELATRRLAPSHRRGRPSRRPATP